MPGLNTMTLSRLQAPPRPWGASHNETGGPPATGIFFSFPPAKKAMNRLSGDQKGKLAESVPGSGCAATAPIGLTQS